MSIFEFMEIHNFIWFSEGNIRNALSSFIAGFLFILAWWIVGDAHMTCLSFKPIYHLCGIFGSISLILVNYRRSNNNFTMDWYDGRCFPESTWMFVGLVTGFAAVFASCWILFADFVTKSSPETPVEQWAGIGLFLQNSFICIASLIFKFGRVIEDDSMY